MRKSVALAVSAGAASLFISTAAHAVVGNWAGPSGAGWSTGTWVGGVPMNQGDTAQYLTTQTNVNGSSSVAINDITGGVTVGTLRVHGATNHSMQFTPNENIFLNEDGAGPGHATVINDIVTPTPVGNPSIFLNPRGAGSTGSFVLQDDLYLINNGNSARTSGSIQIRGPITGAGNIFIENVSNDIGAGQIQFTNSQSDAGIGGFAGNVFINKGAVTFQRGDVFTPSPGNIVTIGAVGSTDDVTLAYNRASGGLGGMENGFIAAATHPDATLIFASATPTADNVQIRTTNTNASAIQLNGNLSFDNRNTLGSIFIIGNRVTGVGKLTKIGVGAMELTNANTYSGGTVVSAGSLKVRHQDAFNNGFGFHDATDGTLGTGNVTVETTATRLEIDAALAAINVIADTAILSLAGGGTLGLADLGYAQLGAGINETVGGLILGGVAQGPGTYTSITSPEYIGGLGSITVVAQDDADFDNDDDVDGNDFLIWQRGIGGAGGTANGNGNADGDGDVDGDDLAVWETQFGDGSFATGAAQTIPEPSAALIALLAAPLALLARRKR